MRVIPGASLAPPESLRTKVMKSKEQQGAAGCTGDAPRRPYVIVPNKDPLIGPSLRRILASLCAALLLSHPGEASQSAREGPEIEIVALRGDNSVHLVNYHRHEQPAVLVRIGGLPVKDVPVTFQLPESGPGGSFLVPDGQGTRKLKSIQVRTDARGRAEAKGFEPNKELGAYLIQVTAEQGGSTAKLEMKQNNIFSATARDESRKRRNNAIFYMSIAAGVIIFVAVALVKASRS